MAKKKIADMKQADGKTYDTNARTVEEILGNYKPKFLADSEGSYKQGLARMNKIDLQRECVRIGLMPHDNRDIMMKRLVEQFNVAEASNRFKRLSKVAPSEQKAPSSKIREILSKGDNKLIY